MSSFDTAQFAYNAQRGNSEDQQKLAHLQQQAQSAASKFNLDIPLETSFRKVSDLDLMDPSSLSSLSALGVSRPDSRVRTGLVPSASLTSALSPSAPYAATMNDGLSSNGALATFPLGNQLPSLSCAHSNAGRSVLSATHRRPISELEKGSGLAEPNEDASSGKQTISAYLFPDNRPSMESREDPRYPNDSQPSADKSDKFEYACGVQQVIVEDSQEDACTGYTPGATAGRLHLDRTGGTIKSPLSLGSDGSLKGNEGVLMQHRQISQLMSQRESGKGAQSSLPMNYENLMSAIQSNLNSSGVQVVISQLSPRSQVNMRPFMSHASPSSRPTETATKADQRGGGPLGSVVASPPVEWIPQLDPNLNEEQIDLNLANFEELPRTPQQIIRQNEHMKPNMQSGTAYGQRNRFVPATDVSENCRDSLDTQTYQATRFSQNTPGPDVLIVSSSNDEGLMQPYAEQKYALMSNHPAPESLDAYGALAFSQEVRRPSEATTAVNSVPQLPVPHGFVQTQFSIDGTERVNQARGSGLGQRTHQTSEVTSETVRVGHNGSTLAREGSEAGTATMPRQSSRNDMSSQRELQAQSKGAFTASLATVTDYGQQSSSRQRGVRITLNDKSGDGSTEKQQYAPAEQHINTSIQEFSVKHLHSQNEPVGGDSRQYLLPLQMEDEKEVLQRRLKQLNSQIDMVRRLRDERPPSLIHQIKAATKGSVAESEMGPSEGHSQEPIDMNVDNAAGTQSQSAFGESSQPYASTENVGIQLDSAQGSFQVHPLPPTTPPQHAGDKYTFRFQPDGSKDPSLEHRLDSLESDSGTGERKLPYSGQYFQSDQLHHMSQKTGAYNTMDQALERVSGERIKHNLQQASQIRLFVENIISPVDVSLKDLSRRSRSSENDQSTSQASFNKATSSNLFGTNGKSSTSQKNQQQNSLETVGVVTDSVTQLLKEEDERKHWNNPLILRQSSSQDLHNDSQYAAQHKEKAVAEWVRGQRPKRVTNAPSQNVLDMYNVRRVEAMAGDVLSRSRAISNERKWLREQQEQIKNYSKPPELQIQRRPESPIFSTSLTTAQLTVARGVKGQEPDSGMVEERKSLDDSLPLATYVNTNSQCGPSTILQLHKHEMSEVLSSRDPEEYNRLKLQLAEMEKRCRDLESAAIGEKKLMSLVNSLDEKQREQRLQAEQRQREETQRWRDREADLKDQMKKLITEHLSRDKVSSHAVSTRRSHAQEVTGQLTEVDSDAENVQPNDHQSRQRKVNNFMAEAHTEDPKDVRIRDLEHQLETLHAFYREQSVAAAGCADKNHDSSICHTSARQELSNIYPAPVHSFERAMAAADTTQSKLQHHQSLPVQLKSIDICDQASPENEAAVDLVSMPQEEILHQVNPTPRVPESPGVDEVNLTNEPFTATMDHDNTMKHAQHNSSAFHRDHRVTGRTMSSLSPSISQGISAYDAKTPHHHQTKNGTLTTTYNGASQRQRPRSSQRSGLSSQRAPAPPEISTNQPTRYYETFGLAKAFESAKQATRISAEHHLRAAAQRQELLNAMLNSQQSNGQQNPHQVTYGEKQLMLEHIAQLELEQAQATHQFERLQAENNILRRFHYNHVTDVRQCLPQTLQSCFEDELFSQWSKLLHVLNRCLSQAFACDEDGNRLDQELLIKYIEKLVRHLQQVERQVQGVASGDIKARHVQLIDRITEQSLALSRKAALNCSLIDPKMPLLTERQIQMRQDQHESIGEVRDTLAGWQEQLRLWLTFLINEHMRRHDAAYRHGLDQFDRPAAAEVKNERDNVNDEDTDDDFYSDFSDADFELDQGEMREALDLCYNLLAWINSNAVEIDFERLFSMMTEDNGQKGSLVTCQGFIEVLVSAGYDYCETSLKHRTDFMCLVRAISCTQKHMTPMQKSLFERVPVGYINYRQFLEDVKTRPYKWWQNTLSSYLHEVCEQGKWLTDPVDAAADELAGTATLYAAQDMPMKGRGDFQCELLKFARYLPPTGKRNPTAYRLFCEQIVKNRLVLAAAQFEPLIESDKTHLTKAMLRRYILQHQINLSRLDNHILVRMMLKNDPSGDAKNHQRILIQNIGNLMTSAREEWRQQRYAERCYKEGLK